VQGLQKGELPFTTQQKDFEDKNGTAKVLQNLQKAHFPQGNQVKLKSTLLGAYFFYCKMR